MKRAFLFAAAIFAVSAPLQAADVDELNCQIESMSDTELVGVVDHVVEQGDPGESRAAPLVRTLSECMGRYGWSAEQGELATMFTLSIAGQSGTSGILTASNIDVSKIEDAVLGDAVFLNAIRARDMSDGVIEAMVNRHISVIQEAVSGHENPDQFYELIGQYMMFRAMAEVAAEQFAGS